MKDMTREDKELLLKDLCARLPYGVKVTNGIYTITLTPCSDTSIIIKNEHILPYLRPMSSITEEEVFDYVASTKEERCIVELPIQPKVESTDWLNAHHFDYRGLIEKGLALEAPEGMYDSNEK